MDAGGRWDGKLLMRGGGAEVGRVLSEGDLGILLGPAGQTGGSLFWGVFGSSEHSSLVFFPYHKKSTADWFASVGLDFAQSCDTD